MNNQLDPDSKEHTGEYHAPWEKSFAKILTPFEEFIHRQTTSGLMLMGTAVLALVLANGPLASSYEHLLHTFASIDIRSDHPPAKPRPAPSQTAVSSLSLSPSARSVPLQRHFLRCYISLIPAAMQVGFPIPYPPSCLSCCVLMARGLTS